MKHYLYFALLLLVGPADGARAATFRFVSPASPLAGQTSGVLTDGGVTISLAALPDGATFNLQREGLGLNSLSVAGATDPEPDRFNLLGGALAGSSEAIAFSFDQQGLLTSLDFDGVKDESFEFFRLETPGGQVLSIFDSQIGLRLVDIGLINEPNVTLLTEIGSPDDDLFGLAIPFGPGDVFRLIYREHSPDPSNYQPGFVPETPNGARFQGLTVELVPEPTSGGVTLAIAAALSRRSRRSV